MQITAGTQAVQPIPLIEQTGRTWQEKAQDPIGQTGIAIAVIGIAAIIIWFIYRGK